MNNVLPIFTNGRRYVNDDCRKFYDATYQITSSSVELNLVVVSEKDNEFSFETYPILSYNGKRTYGPGLDLLMKMDTQKILFSAQVEVRVGLAVSEILKRENNRAYVQLFPFNGDSIDDSLGNMIFSAHTRLHVDELLRGIINFLTIDGDTFEKIISSMGMKYLKENFTARIINLNEGSKINQVFGVPKSILPRIRDDFTKEMDSFQTICQILDGNDAVYMLNFIDEVFEVDGKNSTWKDANKNGFCQIKIYQAIVRLIAEIVSLRKTPMPTLLTYLFRQQYYSSMQASGYPVINTSWISFLEIQQFRNVCCVLRDTLIMYQDMTGFVPSELPSDLFYEHAVITENYNSTKMTQSNVERFAAAVNKYSKLNYRNEQFEIRAPKDVKELVAEGTVLRHCVASYQERIANGKSIVMFVRENKSPDTPFVTVEYDPDCGVTQVKEKFDKDVEDLNVLTFVREWEKGVVL